MIRSPKSLDYLALLALVTLLIPFSGRAEKTQPDSEPTSSGLVSTSGPLQGALKNDDGVFQELPARDILALRDPFQQPEILVEGLVPVTELQKYAITEYKMVGVVTGPKKMRAMLVDPKGKTHFVKQNDKIGTSKGVVQKITTRAVIILEELIDPLGQSNQVLSEIELPGESDFELETGDEMSVQGKEWRGTDPTRRPPGGIQSENAPENPDDGLNGNSDDRPDPRLDSRLNNRDDDGDFLQNSLPPGQPSPADVKAQQEKMTKQIQERRSSQFPPLIPGTVPGTVPETIPAIRPPISPPGGSQ